MSLADRDLNRQLQRFYGQLVYANAAPGLLKVSTLRDRRWRNMRGLMERFGAAVENAPVVFDRYADAPVEGERDVAGLDEGN